MRFFVVLQRLYGDGVEVVEIAVRGVVDGAGLEIFGGFGGVGGGGEEDDGEDSCCELVGAAHGGGGFVGVSIQVGDSAGTDRLSWYLRILRD